MTGGNLSKQIKLDEFEYLAVLTAACLHDFEHPGVNNVYLQKMQDPLAIRHNDISVLESHHIASSFELMLGNPINNWAHKMSSEDFVRVRQIMIDCVLATDMAQHFKELNHLKARMDQIDFNLENEKDKMMLLKFTFHLADISNPVKKWELCKDWTDLLYVEFFL